MSLTLAFDVYGTLIDTQDVVRLLRGMVGDKAATLSACWRSKQLEYSFRRGLMQDYVDFRVCTQQALDHASQEQSITLSNEQKQQLLDHYQHLAPFEDVAEALSQLREEGVRLYAFSNGSTDAVGKLLENAGIREHFIDVVSVDEVKTFKPSPAVYQHLLHRTGTRAEYTWLISSNPFDVTGAVAFGLRACWVKRSDKALFDPWEHQPSASVESLSQLPALVHRT